MKAWKLLKELQGIKGTFHEVGREHSVLGKKAPQTVKARLITPQRRYIVDSGAPKHIVRMRDLKVWRFLH